MNEEYDITKAFQAIEDEIIASMIRNLQHHRTMEEDEEKLWSQWQVEQLKALEKYKVRNQKKYTKQFQDLNKRIEDLIKVANETGSMEQEIEILEAIKNGFKGYHKASGAMQGEFFKLNERKLEALIKATTDDMEKAETAVLRMANDQYRKVIFNAQVYANTGAATYEKAVDMATKDFIKAGLNCVEYANGARHKLSDYVDMAIRTASKRAYLQGEGTMRQNWGIATVIVNKRGNPCPKCLPFCGKVLIDDVWSGGSKGDGPYPLMSYAIECGLYHPRCKDSHTTYFPGISTADDSWSDKELEDIGLQSKQEQEKQYAERQAEALIRMAKYSLDPESRRMYAQKSRRWNIQATKRFEDYSELESYMSKVYNGSVDDDVKALDIRQVSQTLTEFEKVLSDFPRAKQFFRGINTADLGKAALAPNGELALSNTYYQKTTTALLGTGFHEAGHLLELAVIRNNNPGLAAEEIYKLYANGTYAKEIVSKAYKRINTTKGLRDLRNEISGYALKDRSETLAEAIADYYMNGYGASILSRQIVKVLEEELG